MANILRVPFRGIVLMCVSSCFQKLDSFAGKFRDLCHVMVGLPNKVVTGYDSDSYNSYEATTS